MSSSFKHTKLPKINVTLPNREVSAEKLMTIVAQKMCFHSDFRYCIAFETVQNLAHKSVSWHKRDQARLEVMSLLEPYIEFSYRN